MRRDGEGTPPTQSAVVSPFRRARWKQWLTAILVLNVAVGMALSVVLLRHQADARRSVETRLVQTDALAAAQTAVLWSAVATGQPSAVDQFVQDNRTLSELTAKLAGSHPAPDLEHVLAAQRTTCTRQRASRSPSTRPPAAVRAASPTPRQWW